MGKEMGRTRAAMHKPLRHRHILHIDGGRSLRHTAVNEWC